MKLSFVHDAAGTLCTIAVLLIVVAMPLCIISMLNQSLADRWD